MRMRRVWRPLAVGMLVAGVIAVVPPGGAAAADGVFTVYMDAAGSDAADGLTPATGVKTLNRVQQVLAAAAPQTDVEVRIKQGTYVAPTSTWQYYVPNHTVTFLPIDYVYGGGATSIAGRPVFRSDGSAGYWLKASWPSGSVGGDTNLRFYYLQVELYSQGGLAISGATTKNSLGVTVPSNAGANHNTVFGMVFTKLGSKYSSAGFAYGGVDMVNSSDNLIKNNHFTYEENTGSDYGLIHGVYLAHWSKRNTVTGNEFAYISGGPMRTRNDSNDNDIYGNKFTRTGTVAYYSEWFCDADCVAANPGHGRECASHGNVFHDNNTISGYYGSDISWWDLSPDGNSYAGGTGCDNEGQLRVRTYGNT